MSFDSFSPEVLIQIFSHILDVRSKIRLARVSIRFRDCIRDKESWKRNTTLDMNYFASTRQLHSFLYHAKEINVLSFRGLVNARKAAALWKFENKLKIYSFKISPILTTPCPAINSQFVGSCLGKFGELKSIDFRCCQGENCDMLRKMIDLLPQCNNLKHLTLRNFDDRLAKADDNHLVRSLIGMNLETLHLVDFTSVIKWQTLAEVYNNVDSLRFVHLENTRGGIAWFALDQFCQHLEPKAAEAIESITLLDIHESNFQKVLGDLPTMMPSLSRITICEFLSYAQDVKNYIQAIEQFMRECQRRYDRRIEVQLKLFAKPVFTEMLWSKVHEMPVERSATKRLEDGNGWKQTITKCGGRMELDVRPY